MRITAILVGMVTVLPSLCLLAERVAFLEITLQRVGDLGGEVLLDRGLYVSG